MLGELGPDRTPALLLEASKQQSFAAAHIQDSPAPAVEQLGNKPDSCACIRTFIGGRLGALMFQWVITRDLRGPGIHVNHPALCAPHYPKPFPGDVVAALQVALLVTEFADRTADGLHIGDEHLN